ncbi:hypothetical protein N665_0600s0012 [Sinapis alba]|nr:hypothetical protein N665_0600s0012 [Sinapis alba]
MQYQTFATNYPVLPLSLNIEGKLSAAGESIEYRCLIRATDAKKTISTSVGAKDHQRFQASYATILKAHMTALKKRERKDRKKTTDAEKKESTSTTTKPKKL